MKLPYINKIIIDDNKLEDYLLNSNHPDGMHKAKFFISKGFDKKSLREVLIKQANEADVKQTEKINFGIKYIIESTVKSPFNKDFTLRSVWIVNLNENFTKLVTAYSIK